MKVGRKSVQDQIYDILSEYVAEEEEKIDKITKDVAKATAKKLRETSPKSDRGSKHYANGWRVKSQRATKVTRTIMSVVYNATKPGLTHLLSEAHDIRNQFGEYGRSKPDPHIAKAEEYGNELYLERLEREL